MRFRQFLWGLLAITICLRANAQQSRQPDIDAALEMDTWSGAEYKLVSGAIKTGSVALPLFTDPNGSRLLKKLTSGRNLEYCSQASVPLRDRFMNTSDILIGMSEVSLAYADLAKKSDRKIADELSVVIVFVLEATACANSLVAELYDALPANVTFNSSQRGGIESICSGTKTVIGATEEGIYDRDYMAPRNAAALLNSVALVMPHVARCIDKDFARQFARRLKAHESQFKSERERSDFNRITGLLKEIESGKHPHFLSTR